MIVYVFKRNDDYKSIALPAELQGHLIFKIFILINLINKSKMTIIKFVIIIHHYISKFNKSYFIFLKKF